MSNLYYWVADWNLSRAEASLLLGRNVEDMVDCPGASAGNLRQTSARRFGVYVTGSDGIRWTQENIDSLPPGSQIIRIDQSNSDLVLSADVKVAKDVEAGASQIDTAVEVARQRLHAHHDYTIYVERSMLSELEAAVEKAGLPRGHVIAYQYASADDPASANDPLPGTRETIHDVNCDLSVISSAYFTAAPAAAEHAPAHHVEARHGTTELTWKRATDGTWTGHETRGVL